MSSPLSLKEYRCTCGKLLFRGALFCSTVEIKCKRCGSVMMYQMDSSAIARRFLSFTLVVDEHEHIVDASNGIEMFGYEHKQLLGKEIGDLFPLVRDIPSNKHTPGESFYHIQDNTLLLQGHSPVSVESYFIPIVENGSGARYRVFTIAK